jgi:hypothetical protein
MNKLLKVTVSLGLLIAFPVALVRAENIVYPADAGVVNVKLAPYKAYGDGIHDDTTVIQKAITDANGGRKIIYFPNGTYLVSATLVMPGNSGPKPSYGFWHLQGQSRTGAVILLKTNTLNVPHSTFWELNSPLCNGG